MNALFQWELQVLQPLGIVQGDLCEHLYLEEFCEGFLGRWCRRQQTWDLILLLLLATCSTGSTDTGKHGKQHRHLLSSAGLTLEAEEILAVMESSLFHLGPLNDAMGSIMRIFGVLEDGLRSPHPSLIVHKTFCCTGQELHAHFWEHCRSFFRSFVGFA